MNEFRREDTTKLIGLVRRPDLTGERTQVSLIGRAECLRDFSVWLNAGLLGTDRTIVFKLHTPSQLYGYDHYLKFIQIELDENAQDFVIKSEGVTILVRGNPDMLGYLARCCASIAEMLDSTNRDDKAGAISPFKYVVAEGDGLCRYVPGTDVLIVQGVWEGERVPA